MDRPLDRPLDRARKAPRRWLSRDATFDPIVDFSIDQAPDRHLNPRFPWPDWAESLLERNPAL